MNTLKKPPKKTHPRIIYNNLNHTGNLITKPIRLKFLRDSIYEIIDFDLV